MKALSDSVNSVLSVSWFGGKVSALQAQVTLQLCAILSSPRENLRTIESLPPRTSAIFTSGAL